MRIGILATAALLTAIPVSAQGQVPKDVHGPRTLLPWMVACADTPVTSKPNPRIVLRGTRSSDNHAMAARGSEVNINRTPNDGLAVGQKYAIRRLQRNSLGFTNEGDFEGAIATVGFITITAIDRYNALANVDFACTAIMPGDYLDTYTEPPLPTTAGAMLYPDFDDRANVLRGSDGRVIFGDGDTLSINRGTDQAAAVGARFAFYRDRRDGMPLFYLGDGVVMELGERTSKLVVVYAVDAVTTEDIAVPRKLQRPPN
jgi:hypothetical protein